MPEPRKTDYQAESALAKAVRTGIDKPFVDWADVFGKEIARGRGAITTSQIRNVFGTVKKMEMSGRVDTERLLLLRAQMAYARGRHPALATLEREIKAAIDAIIEVKDEKELTEQRFKRFCKGFEAILAYHKSHGGK